MDAVLSLIDISRESILSAKHVNCVDILTHHYMNTYLYYIVCM